MSDGDYGERHQGAARPRNEAVELLREISGALRIVLARLPEPRIEPASDAELDGQYGNPILKVSPRGAGLRETKGLRMDECTVEELRALAGVFASFAQRNDAALALDAKGRPKSSWDRGSASLALGWAARKEREAKAAPVNAPGMGDAYEEDEPAAPPPEEEY